MVQGRAGSGNVVPLMVRVPEDLRDRIKAAADANGRSQNSEIVATLVEAYPDGPTEFEIAMSETMKDGVPRVAMFGGHNVIVEPIPEGGVSIRREDGEPLIKPDTA